MISGDSVQILTYLVYTAAGLGAGVVTGLAGLSAAVVITPMLMSLCGWESYDAVTVALASDVLASMLSAYTYYKNKNIDLRRGGLVTVTAFLGTIAGSYCGFLFSRHSPDGLGYISMLTTVFLGVKFLVKPITGGTDASAAAEQSGRKTVLAMLLGCGIGWVRGFSRCRWPSWCSRACWARLCRRSLSTAVKLRGSTASWELSSFCSALSRSPSSCCSRLAWRLP